MSDVLIGGVLVGLGVTHLVYTYVGYPWIVSLLPRCPDRPGSTPAPRLVSIVIAARDGGREIAQKVNELRPSVRLDCEIIVVLDGPDVAATAALGPLLGVRTGKAAVCAVFRADGQRAFVSLNPSGIAAADVPAMTYVRSIATDGFIACGMIKLNADHVVIAASGSGGHTHTLDMTTETLSDRGVLGAASWHSFNMTADGTRGFGSSPLSDEVIVMA